VRLLDGAGNVLAGGFATAEGEWTTQGFVPSRGTLSCERPAGPAGGMLAVLRNNVRDDRPLDGALELPVVFERAAKRGGTGREQRERPRQVDGHAEGARERQPLTLDAP